MRDHNGIGIAAPQLGVFRNFLVMQTQAGETLDMVNPEILQMYGHELEGFEACLSIPPCGNGCPVARLQQIKVAFGTSENPNTRRVQEFSGMDAIVIQHEMDHLTGTFFIDRVSQGRKKDVLQLLNGWKMQQAISQVSKEKRFAKDIARS
jgi:peptide deformylase